MIAEEWDLGNSMNDLCSLSKSLEHTLLSHDYCFKYQCCCSFSKIFILV